MLLISHIAVALVSLLVATLSLASPSTQGLKLSYFLVGLTIATGTILTVQAPGHLLQACATGLVYLAVTFALIFAAHRKLVRENG